MSDNSPAPSVRQCFEECRRLSIKCDTYFPVYERLFSPFRERPAIFVEVGVLGGGSLEMWRRFFGDRVRIIGIDFNEQARALEQEGFEIYIGDQSDPGFWKGFFDSVGSVDVLLDDGGHTTLQQVTTLVEGLPHVRDGGLIVVEDVVSSYLPQFGNPSKHSFASMSSQLSDAIHHRCFADPPLDSFAGTVHSIEIFTSMLAFHVDRTLCRRTSRLTNGRERRGGPADLRNASSAGRQILSRWRGLARLLPANIQDQVTRLAVGCMERVSGERGWSRRRLDRCRRGSVDRGR